MKQTLIVISIKNETNKYKLKKRETVYIYMVIICFVLLLYTEKNYILFELQFKNFKLSMAIVRRNMTAGIMEMYKAVILLFRITRIRTDITVVYTSGQSKSITM